MLASSASSATPPFPTPSKDADDLQGETFGETRMTATRYEQRLRIATGPFSASGNAGSFRAVALVLVIGVGLLFTSGSQAAAPFFWSGFESNTALATPSNCWSTGCWQSITGTDNSTAYTWPPSGLASGQLFQLLADNRTGTMDPTTIGNYMFNEILPVTGHKGTSTMTLYSQVTE